MALSCLSLKSWCPQGMALKYFTIAFLGCRRKMNTHTLRVSERPGGGQGGKASSSKSRKDTFLQGQRFRAAVTLQLPRGNPSTRAAPTLCSARSPLQPQIHHLLNPGRAAGAAYPICCQLLFPKALLLLPDPF